MTVEEDGGVEARYTHDGAQWSDEDGDSAPALIATALDNLRTVIAFQAPSRDE